MAHSLWRFEHGPWCMGQKVILTVVIEVHSKLIFSDSFSISIGSTCKLSYVSNGMLLRHFPDIKSISGLKAI